MYNLLIEVFFYIKNIMVLVYNNILLYSINNNNNGVSSIYLWNKYYNYKDEIWNILLVKKILNFIFLILEIIIIFIQKLWYEYLDVINLNLYIFNNNKLFLEKFLYNYWIYNEQIKNLSWEILSDITKINFKYFNLLNSDSEIFNDYLKKAQKKDKFLKEMKKNHNFFRLIFMYKNMNANIALLNYGYIHDLNINNYNYNLNVGKNDYNLRNINYNASLYNNTNNRQEKWLNLSYYWKLQQEVFEAIYRPQNIWIWDEKAEDYLLYGENIYTKDKRILKNYHESLHIFDDKRNWKRLRFKKRPVKVDIFAKAFGGYTNWWLWHQDAYYIHGIEGAYNKVLWSYDKQWKVLKTGNVFKYMDTPRRYKGSRIRMRGLKHGVWWRDYRIPLDIRPGIWVKKIKPPIHGTHFWQAEKKLWTRFLFSNDLIGDVDVYKTSGASKYFFPKKKRNMLRVRDIDPDILGKNRKKFRKKIGIKKIAYQEVFKRYANEILTVKKLTYMDYIEGTYYFGRYKTNFSILQKKKPKLFSKYLFISFSDQSKWNPLVIESYKLIGDGKKVRQLDKSILKIGENLMDQSKNIFQWSQIPLRGFLMKKYILRSYFHGEKNFFYNQMRLPKKIFSEVFYLNIEDSRNNSILLNYINKKFYIKYMKMPFNYISRNNSSANWFQQPYKPDYTSRDTWRTRVFKDPSKEIQLPNKLYIIDNNLVKGTVAETWGKAYHIGYDGWAVLRDANVTKTKIPQYKKILIKKQYIENIFDLYKKEEKLILDFLNSKNNIKNINNFYNNFWKKIKKLFYIFYKSVINLLLFYKEFTINFVSLSLEGILNYIIKTLKKEYFIRNFNNYLQNSYNINIFKLDEYLKNYIIILKRYIIYLWKNVILEYYWIFIFFFTYSIITILLILIIKNILPKNIIYGVKIQDKEKINFLKSLEEKISTNNKFVNKWDKFIYEWDLKKKKNNLKKKVKRNYIFEKLLNNITENYYILYQNFLFEKNIEKLENNLKIRLSLNILKTNKSKSWIWVLIKKIIKNIITGLISGINKLKIFNLKNIIKNVVKLRKKKSWIYIIKLIWLIIIWRPFLSIKNKVILFFKSLIFFLLASIFNLIITFLKIIKELIIQQFDEKKTVLLNLRLIFLKISKEKWNSYIDRRYNSGRKIIWEENKLDEKKNKFIYYFPRYFVTLTRIFRTLLVFRGILLEQWFNKMQRTVYKNARSLPPVNYNELFRLLEKHWIYLVFRRETDLDIENTLDIIYWKLKQSIIKLKRRKLNDNTNIEFKKKKLDNLLIDILNLNFKKKKLDRLKKYTEETANAPIFKERAFGTKLMSVLKSRSEGLFPLDSLGKSIRAISNTNNKIEEQEEKEKIIQNLRYNFRNEVEKKKLEEVTSKKKILQIKYEKILREINIKLNIIDRDLDEKETIFYESIKEYNQDLENILLIYEEKKKLEEKKINDWKEKNNIINSSKLYTYGKNLIIYKIQTTIGRRLNYIFSSFFLIFLIWIEHIRKIMKNDQSVQQLWKIIYLNFKEYIYNMYWKYIIIWNKKQAFKKLGNDIITILKYSMIIFVPVLLYIGIIHIIIIFHIIALLILWILNSLKKKKKEISKKKWYNTIYKLYITLSLLFKNLQTNRTVLNNLYIILYKYCAIIQRNIYFIKGSFFINNKNKKVIIGLKNILNYLTLKYKVFIEEKKKAYNINKGKNKNLRKNLVEWKQKWIIIEVLWNINLKKIKNNWKNNLIILIYKINKQILDINEKEFLNMKNKILKNDIKDILILKKDYKLNWKNTGQLLINYVNYLLKSIKIIIKYQYRLKKIKKWEKKKKKIEKKTEFWKKVEYILLNKKLSNWCKEQKYQLTSLEYFLLYQASKVQEGILTFKLVSIRTERYWKVFYLKSKILAKLDNFFVRIEKTYKNLITEKYSKYWNNWQKIRFLYNVYIISKHLKPRSIYKINEVRVSRDLFFFKKAKDRKKLLRHYFYKGVINWISYKFFKKTIFNNMKGLKPQKLKVKKGKYKYIYYKIPDISPEFHMGKYLFLGDPELWALIILYQCYYNLFFKYWFNIEEPIDWYDYIVYSRDFKWRIGSHNTSIRVSSWHKGSLDADLITEDFLKTFKNLNLQPTDLFIRWIYFLVEYDVFGEDYLEQDNKSKKKMSWHDLALTHILTYDKETDSLKFELNEFIHRESVTDSVWSMFFLNRNETFKEHRHMDIAIREQKMRETINKKNKGIKDTVLKERLKRSKDLLVRSVRFQEVLTQEVFENRRQFEKEMDFFFKMRVDLFERMSEFDIMDYSEFIDDNDQEYRLYNFTALQYFREEYFVYNSSLNSHNSILENIDEERKKEWKVKKLFGGMEYYDPDKTTEKARNYVLEDIKEVQEQIDLLDSHFALVCFDATIDEISQFLNLEMINLLGENDSKSINYINMTVGIPSLLEDVNKFGVLEEDKNFFLEDTYVTPIWETKFLKFEGDIARTTGIFDIPEDNKLLYQGTIYEDHISYNEKIKHIPEATEYKILDKRYYGSDALLWWTEVIIARSNTLKNVKRKSYRNKKYYVFGFNYPLVYIHNIRWSLEQWLGIGDIKEEEKIVKLRNLLIFNERYDFQKVRSCPLRLKAPICLTMIKDYKFFENLKKKFVSVSGDFVLFGKIIGKVLNANLVWSFWKQQQEKELNQSIEKIVLWVLDPKPWDKEAVKFKEKNKYLLPEDFINIVPTYNDMVLKAVIPLSWDFIRYYDAWIWMENEIPMAELWGYKLMEYTRTDEDIREAIDAAEEPCLLFYSPINYHILFNQNRGLAYYVICKLLYYLFILNLFNEIFYNPGQFLYSPTLIVLNALMVILFKFWSRKIKYSWREIGDGKELYLYKFQATKVITFEEETKRRFEEKLDKESREFMDSWKDTFARKLRFDYRNSPTKEEINQEIDKFYLQKGEEDHEWWKAHSYIKNKENFGNEFANKIYMTEKSQFLIAIYLSIFFGYWWINERFRYREANWLWDYYLDKQKRKYRFIAGIGDSKKNFTTRTWNSDNFFRLNIGGNEFSNWYINVYRNYKGADLLGLDYIPVPKRWEYFYIPIEDPLHKTSRAYFRLARWDAEWAIFSKKLIQGSEIVSKKIRRKWSIYKIMTKKGGIRDKYWKDYTYEKKRWSYFHNLKEDHITPYKYTNKEYAYVRWRSELRSKLIEFYYGERWLKIRHNTPYEIYMKFLKKLKNRWDFDHIQSNPTYFTWRLKKIMSETVKTDRVLFLKNKVEKNYALTKEWELFMIKRNSFNTGEPLDLKILLSITEMEKHKYVLYYNFAKCKIDRLNKVLKLTNKIDKVVDLELEALKKLSIMKENKYTFLKKFMDWIIQDNSFLNFKNNIKSLEDQLNAFKHVRELLKKDKIAAENYVTKSNQFLQNIFKNISYEEKINYKLDLLSKLWANKTNWGWNTLIDIKNIFMHNKDINLFSTEQVLEFLEILIKFLKNIF